MRKLLLCLLFTITSLSIPALSQNDFKCSDTLGYLWCDDFEWIVNGPNPFGSTTWPCQTGNPPASNPCPVELMTIFNAGGPNQPKWYPTMRLGSTGMSVLANRDLNMPVGQQGFVHEVLGGTDNEQNRRSCSNTDQAFQLVPPAPGLTKEISQLAWFKLLNPSCINQLLFEFVGIDTIPRFQIRITKQGSTVGKLRTHAQFVNMVPIEVPGPSYPINESCFSSGYLRAWVDIQITRNEADAQTCIDQGLRCAKLDTSNPPKCTVKTCEIALTTFLQQWVGGAWVNLCNSVGASDCPQTGTSCGSQCSSVTGSACLIQPADVIGMANRVYQVRIYPVVCKQASSTLSSFCYDTPTPTTGVCATPLGAGRATEIQKVGVWDPVHRAR